MVSLRLSGIGLALLAVLQLSSAQPHGGRHARRFAAPAEVGTAATGSNGGIVYSPYNSDGTCKDGASFDSDTSKLASFSFLRLYGTDCNQVPNGLSAAKKYGFKLFLGIHDIANCESEISKLITMVGPDWNHVHTVAIGNEVVNSGLMGPGDVVTKVSTARDLLKAGGYTGPVVAPDTFVAIMNNPVLCGASDYVAANCHPFFDGKVDASASGDFLKTQSENVSKACGGKKVLITETGWPHQGGSNGAAVPSVENQAAALSSIKSAMGPNVIYFTAQDDLWKKDNPATFNAEKRAPLKVGECSLERGHVSSWRWISTVSLDHEKAMNRGGLKGGGSHYLVMVDGCLMTGNDSSEMLGIIKNHSARSEDEVMRREENAGKERDGRHVSKDDGNPGKVLVALALLQTTTLPRAEGHSVAKMRYLFLPSLLSLSLSLLSLLSQFASSQYTPASALLSADSSTLYLFLPSPQTAEFKFVSLNVSDRVSTRNMSNAFRDLPAPPPPPKSPGSGQISMTPLLFSDKGAGKNNVMILLTGSCDSDLGLYEYNFSDSSGVWRSRDVKSGMEVAPRGRNHAAGFSYQVSATSAVAPAPTFINGAAPSDEDSHEYEQGNAVATNIHRKAYLFGGSCPGGPCLGGEAGPVYTNSMLEFEFPAIREFSYIEGNRKGLPESTSGPDSITPVALVERGSGDNSYDWPIPESGFSFTTISKGDSMTAVMIGGHTGRAFVDVRQVAVYLVPEGRWRFADVSLPKSLPPKLPTSLTKLGNVPEPTPGAMKEDPSIIVEPREEGFTRRIDSRAGHTAVATRDGKRVIVYGGWVGDVNTPAEPRLIVLDMSGEIGRGGWKWEVPYIFGGELGPPGDGHQDGLAGHAAVMLDGDVMMITSGYKISPFEAGKAPQISEGTYLFNVTSNTWTSTYNPPKVAALVVGGEKGGKERKDSKTTIVLGALLGLLSVIAGVALFFWCRRRNKNSDEEDPVRRNTRETEGRRTFGFYSKEGSNASADSIGIVEKSYAARMLGLSHQPSCSLSSSMTPNGASSSQSSTSTSSSPPQLSRQMQVCRGAAAPARVSTILESDEESIHRHSSAGVTNGSTDLAEMYNRSLAFAEKMAQQDTIYERTRESSRSGTPTSDEWMPDVSAFPKPPPPAAPVPVLGGRPRLVAATLSSESLKKSFPKAPLRIPYARGYPPGRARAIAPPFHASRVRTLTKRALFFPSPPRPAIAQRSISLDATTTAGSSTISTITPSPSTLSSSNPSFTPFSNIPPSPSPPKPRGMKVTAVRNALPPIKPSSPLSLFASTSFRSVSNIASLGRDDVSGGEVGGGRRKEEGPAGTMNGMLEAAVGAGRVVQIMFTAPKGTVRIVNYDDPMGM
ncbi:unnamed protein product [Tuber aestivum]|uniref:Glycoside hydrolase family 17 protein n=1 Tax=Tuber aestivum TaxID=59557 RepID=A0A292PNB4_9PEZI|nr:unnamed protein product [Tuber aestivum]